MKKILEFKSEIISWIFLILILSLFVTPILNNSYFSYANFILPTKNIIAVILIFLIFILRSFKKLNIIVLLNNFGKRELIYSYTYYGLIFILFLLILYLNYLSFIYVVFIISLELGIIITNYQVVHTRSVHRDILKYMKIKDITFLCLIVILLLENMPFEIYNIPMNYVLSIMYIIIQVNIIYKLYN